MSPGCDGLTGERCAVSHFPRMNRWCADTQPYLLMSSKFHTSCRHRSSAVGKTWSRAGCEMSPSRWWMADSLKPRHSCLVRCDSSELHQSAVALLFFFICAKIMVKYEGLSSCGQLQTESQRLCVSFCEWDGRVARCEMKFTSACGRWNDSSSWVLKWQKSELMRKQDLHVQIDSKEIHSAHKLKTSCFSLCLPHSALFTKTASV